MHTHKFQSCIIKLYIWVMGHYQGKKELRVMSNRKAYKWVIGHMKSRGRNITERQHCSCLLAHFLHNEKRPGGAGPNSKTAPPHADANRWCTCKLYVYMCVCLWIYIYIYIYVYILHTHIMYWYICMYIDIFAYIFKYIYIYIYTYI